MYVVCTAPCGITDGGGCRRRCCCCCCCSCSCCCCSCHDSDASLKRRSCGRSLAPNAAEAEILSHLHHPAIITHIESFEEDGHLCIVTDFCEKGDLATKMEERKGVWIAEETVLDLFVQAALALHY